MITPRKQVKLLQTIEGKEAGMLHEATTLNGETLLNVGWGEWIRLEPRQFIEVNEEEILAILKKNTHLSRLDVMEYMGYL
jgi:hypothetical protein